MAPSSCAAWSIAIRAPSCRCSSALACAALPGQTTAIIGGTGAGKTTLLDLIPRLIDTTAGAVLVDGVDVREFELEALWSRIGVVPQRPYLFSGTVATNLRYGNPAATDAELWTALEIAQGRDFVEGDAGAARRTDRAGRYEQLGRSAPAARDRTRALLRKPSVFLLDDSFSALDLATEARLRVALRPHVANAAVIMVAQRVASVIDADQIIVLDGGKIVGLGTHGELLATCPTYLEIVRSQQGEAAT